MAMHKVRTHTHTQATSKDMWSDVCGHLQRRLHYTKTREVKMEENTAVGTKQISATKGGWK